MDPAIETNTNAGRPLDVARAVKVLLASILIGLVMSAITAAQRVTGVPLVLAMLMVLAFFGVYLFLVSRISAGRNWARIVFLVLVLFGLPFATLNFMAEIKRSIPSGSLSILVTLLQVVGTYLLFTKNSNLWFKSRK